MTPDLTACLTRRLMTQTDYSEKWPVTSVTPASLNVTSRFVWRRCGR